MQRTSFASVRYLTSYQANNGYPILSRIRNYYDVLKVPVNCSRSEIKRAYIELSKKYHPDGSRISSNSEEFVKVCEAYKILYKRVSRDNYDTRLKSQFYMVPPLDMSFTSHQNVHKSWKKYQASIRYKQFGHKVPSFHGSSIIHKKPLVINSKSLISVPTVNSPTICEEDSSARESTFTPELSYQTEESSRLFMYFMSSFSLVGVLLAYNFLNKRKRQSPKIPTRHSL